MSSVCSFSLSFVVQISKKFARDIIRNSYGDYPSIDWLLAWPFLSSFLISSTSKTEITSYSLTTAPESCLEDSPMVLNSMLWPRTGLYLVPERDSVGPIKIGRYSVICVNNLQIYRYTVHSIKQIATTTIWSPGVIG